MYNCVYQTLDNHFIYLCSSKWSVSSLYGLKADNGIIYVRPRISRISQICWLTFLSSNVRVTVSPCSWQPAGDYYYLSTLMIVKRFPAYTPGAMLTVWTLSEYRWHCLLIGFWNSDCLEHCVAWFVLPPHWRTMPGIWGGKTSCKATLSSNPPLSAGGISHKALWLQMRAPLLIIKWMI